MLWGCETFSIGVMVTCPVAFFSYSNPAKKMEEKRQNNVQNEMTIAGPACTAAALPLITKIPAPKKKKKGPTRVVSD
jgi:hypothetical protein